MSFTSLKSTAIGLAASLMLLAAAPANAAPFSFSGAFSGDADVQWFDFVVGGPGIVTIKTTSYALGGFDPVVTLYDSSGTWITFADDDGGLGFDAVLNEFLAAGSYKLALTQSDNIDFSFGFQYAPSDTHFTNVVYGCSQQQFCDIANNSRTPNWALEISGEGVTSAVALAQTPLPAALPLFATGLGALGLVAYRRRRKTAAV